MKKRKKHKIQDCSGSSFDSFLDESGIREESERVAINRVRKWQRERDGSGRSKQRPYKKSAT